ncbi:MAG TPA: hypothetical protein VKB59_02835 [Micromonosporaceae bacterium]|nr:hypothetical protein [Micromonosporaceae bacterium]
MAQSAVENWFDGQPPHRQNAWLAIAPPRFRIPAELAFTVPAKHRETWLRVAYLGFGDTDAWWFAAGPLAHLLIVRRSEVRTPARGRSPSARPNIAGQRADPYGP